MSVVVQMTNITQCT